MTLFLHTVVRNLTIEGLRATMCQVDFVSEQLSFLNALASMGLFTYIINSMWLALHYLSVKHRSLFIPILKVQKVCVMTSGMMYLLKIPNN